MQNEFQCKLTIKHVLMNENLTKSNGNDDVHDACDLNISEASVWSDEETVTFLKLIHETNRNVIFPSYSPRFSII